MPGGMVSGKLFASISRRIKYFGVILARQAKMGLKLKWPSPIVYNFELKKKLGEDWLI
jgi:hypothetical protein